MSTSPSPPRPPDAESAKSILIVDDDDVDREALQRLLRKAAPTFRLYEASSVASARALLGEREHDCVLLDYHLREAIGLTLLPDVRAHSARVCPVILTTLRDTETLMVEVMRSGVADYLAKSQLDVERLRTVIQRAMVWAAKEQGKIDAQKRQLALAVQRQKQHEQSLRDELAQAQSANRAKSAFLANLSHEIRTPMNAVIGLSYLLERTRLDADQADLVGKVQVAGKALLSIINNVLDLSKIEAAELRIEHAPFDLDRVLQELDLLASVQAQAKGIEFSIQAPALGPRVGDATRLQQVLSNLTHNAIKFTEHGQVSLSVAETLGPDGGECLQFVVRDTGIGIPDDARARLFQAFVQADASTTRRFGGTGLGLSIVKQLTELMGGRVAVYSVLGQGSEFQVVLPLRRCEPAEFSASEPPVLADAPNARLLDLRVLVVDDSAINREVARRLLEMEGAWVRQAEHGQDAVQRLLDEPDGFDLVLMDVQMPVLDGLDATRRIRSGLGLVDLPIIGVSAGALDTERLLALQAGMNDFVAKPIEPERLIQIVRRRINGSRGTPMGRMGRTDRAADADRADAMASVSCTASGALAWPQVAGIDMSAARRRLGDDLNLFTAMLQRLLAESDDLRQPVSAQASDRGEWARRMHRLQGSASTLGAEVLAHWAQRAELQARGDDLDGLRTALQGVSQHLQALDRAARPFLDAAAAGERSRLAEGHGLPLSSTALHELMHGLRAANMAAGRQFRALAPALLARLGEGEFLRLKAQMDALHFEAAAQLLSTLLPEEAPQQMH